MSRLLPLILLTLIIAVAAIMLHRPAPAGRVVVTIKPLHSLVAAVMAGTGEEPVLLVDSAASLHDYQLKPSQALALEKADIVFFIDERFETFLPPVMVNKPLSAEPGLLLLPLRHSHEASHHESSHEETSHHHEEMLNFDPHLWLSPANAHVLVQAIVRELSARYPEKAEIYKKNGKQLEKTLQTRDAVWKASIASLKDKPFLVFHDAYQYLEQHYGLTVLGSLTDSPEQLAGAKRLQRLHARIQKDRISCVFAEPGMPPRLVQSLIAGTSAKAGILDPEGRQLEPGAALYFDMMQFLVDNLHKCLD